MGLIRRRIRYLWITRTTEWFVTKSPDWLYAIWYKLAV